MTAPDTAAVVCLAAALVLVAGAIAYVGHALRQLVERGSLVTFVHAPNIVAMDADDDEPDASEAWKRGAP